MSALSVLAISAATALAAAPYGMKSLESVDPQGYAARAQLMMKDGNYVGAVDQIRQALREGDSPFCHTLMQECEYRLAIALYERGETECVERLRNYAAAYPASEYAPQALMKVADYYFFDHEFGQALTAYEEVDKEALPPSLQAPFTYRRGLSLIKTGHFGEARPAFESLLSVKEYANAARFYNAYLDYVDGHYDKALKGFELVESPKTAANTVKGNKLSWEYSPTGLEAEYYITQIKFHRGEYESVIRDGSTLIRTAPVKELIPEMNRVIGESHYKLGNENEAWKFLDEYMKAETTSPAESALYTMGVLEYNRRNYSRAEELFTPLTDRLSAVGQSAYLYLGQCAMQRGDNVAASVAFEKAYNLNFDRDVSETALYNYASACISGGRVPFGKSSVEVLENFINSYPRSRYAADVDEYLAAAYYNEKNYTRALASINRIISPSEKVLAAKQKVLYGLGVEALSNGRCSDAIGYMSQAVAMSRYDKPTAVQATLWLADACYASADYPKAQKNYESFLKQSESGDTNRPLAGYNLAYTLYMQDKFSEARNIFSQWRNRLPQQMQADATLRMADCDYYTGLPARALTGYAEAIAADCPSADYAALQHANMQGMTGNNTAKLSELTRMISAFDGSVWLPAAMLEKAQTLIDMGRTKEALSEYRSLLDEYPQAVESRQGMLQMAITLANAGREDEAVEAYSQVISRWPSSTQAQAANADLRQIYARRGELNEYRSFLASIPDSPQLNDSDMEQLSFEAAENDVAENADNIAKMQQYVEQYPNGTYLAPALYHIASSQYSRSRYKEALSTLSTLIARRPDTAFALDALVLKGDILENALLSDPDEVVAAYTELEQRGGADYAATAYAGIMRNTSDSSQRLQYASRLLTLGGLSAEEAQEARYYHGLASLALGDNAQAEADFKELTANFKTLYGAKAAVELGEYYLSQSRLSQAEKLLSDFTEEGTPHQYWLARGFITLADVYTAQGKSSLAKEYLRSLKENYPGSEPDIHDMINQRLNSAK